ncbi:hypothetical protein K435DRAFT_886949 [Dendrothele bispora CBS 962.96]|uniref:Uncharacterized protein n=1 Tax=Dendrothele bispora (strain CBS 962.96) TaxID=1314807 RepID=A0A4S8M7X3_DENBC|nr:hypothetical protein K435DRAFT_886949 [Dendrothele bispora CBS 962.96]
MSSSGFATAPVTDLDSFLHLYLVMRIKKTSRITRNTPTCAYEEIMRSIASRQREEIEKEGRRNITNFVLSNVNSTKFLPSETGLLREALGRVLLDEEILQLLSDKFIKKGAEENIFLVWAWWVGVNCDPPFFTWAKKIVLPLVRVAESGMKQYPVSISGRISAELSTNVILNRGYQLGVSMRRTCEIIRSVETLVSDRLYDATVHPNIPSSPSSPDIYKLAGVPLGRYHLYDLECGKASMTAIDLWLRANIKELRAKPGDTSVQDKRLLTTNVVQDVVSCEVKMEYNKGKMHAPYNRSDPNDDPFVDEDWDDRDGDRFELVLVVTIPNQPPPSFPSIHPRVWSLKSPRILLGTCMQPGDHHSFMQPRCIMIEALASIALWEDNIYQGISRDILHWVSSVLFVQQARLVLDGVDTDSFQTPSRRVQPRNFKISKPKATVQKQSARQASTREIVENGWDLLFSSPLLDRPIPEVASARANMSREMSMGTRSGWMDGHMGTGYRDTLTINTEISEIHEYEYELIRGYGYKRERRIQAAKPEKALISLALRLSPGCSTLRIALALPGVAWQELEDGLNIDTNFFNGRSSVY